MAEKAKEKYETLQNLNNQITQEKYFYYVRQIYTFALTRNKLVARNMPTCYNHEGQIIIY